MQLLQIILCLAPFVSGFRVQRSSGTLVDFADPKVNRELLVHLASLVNGKNSRVVRKLNTVSRLCLDSIEGMSDRCQLASIYNDCLNENMIEFAFPLDIAEEAVRKMPFHLIQPNIPKKRNAGA
ncbi:unnamed protein product [Arctia plantaginis]|uniref:Uncharacterized protein n=1 Tax=Arctia plantaginis TaxID=874455 RepID=A0A8S1AZW5_ARCPL|nr:unnamed protein product [Arctia plantaginis]CAB3252509.1 unnamed protein product [Arctia plantaginis]